MLISVNFQKKIVASRKKSLSFYAILRIFVIIRLVSLTFYSLIIKINERSIGIERGYEDLIQWQARVNAKQQLL